MSSANLGAATRTAHAVAADWGVTLGAPFALGRHAYVAPTADGAVLKVAPAEDDEADEEPDALELWNGSGAVRLLRRDRARRAMLLERAIPGTDLSHLPDDTATAVAVSVALRLWRPAGAPFRWVGDHVPRWLAAAEQGGEPGSQLVPLARELYEALEVGRSTLVHGDFHHHNILDAGGRYVTIDPKPMLGDPEYDVPSFLRNPMHYTMRLDETERRISAFVAAGLDEPRIRAWTVIRCAFLGADADEVRVLRALV